MQLLMLVIAIAFIQIWGAANPLHRDGWFHRWLQLLAASRLLETGGGLAALGVGLPVATLLLVQLLLFSFSPWLLLPFGVLVLLYSFGRGEFAEAMRDYTQACREQDWQSALDSAKCLSVSVADIAQDDWPTLHRQVLEQAGYRGFERMFAVLFWFFVLGPTGAFLYRLLFLYARDSRPNDEGAAQVLWLLEWPAVRVLGLSLAFTGNFVNCYERWRECLFCPHRTSVQVLGPAILGALSVDEGMTQTCEVTRRELELLYRLYTRTLWLWLAAAALVILMR